MIKNGWLQWIFLDHPWMIEMGLALFLLFFLNFGLKKILNRAKKGGHKESPWRSSLGYAAVIPARVLLWLLFATFILDLIAREWQMYRFFLLESLSHAGIVLCLAWFLLRWKKAFFQARASFAEKQEVESPNVEGNQKKTDFSSFFGIRRKTHLISLDPFTLEIISKGFTVTVLFLATLLTMQIFGLNVIPLITFGGIGAAMLGIAGKEVISNFFGGMMIYVTRPFMVHDMIELPERKLMGSIEEIGWYFTSIRDLEKKPIYIPNSVFSTEPMINQSRMTHRRIDELFTIRYEDLQVAPKILEDIRSLFNRRNGIDHHQPIYIFLKDLGEVSLHIEVKAYVHATQYEDFMELRQTLLEEICKIIEKHGAQMPYPKMEIAMNRTFASARLHEGT